MSLIGESDRPIRGVKYRGRRVAPRPTAGPVSWDRSVGPLLGILTLLSTLLLPAIFLVDDGPTNAPDRTNRICPRDTGASRTRDAGVFLRVAAR